MQTSLSDNVHLNGGVTARVVHGTSVNLGDRHNEVMCLKDGRKSVSYQKEKKKRRREEREGEGARRGDLIKVMRGSQGGGGATGSPMAQNDRPASGRAEGGAV